MTEALETEVRTRLPAIRSARTHYVRHAACKVHYQTLGTDGPAMVFVHGWACNIRFWHEQATAFADKARLIFVDLPGHGSSDKPDTRYSMEHHAGAVSAVLEAAGVDRAVFVGHSMGAAVLCRLYRQAPEKFAALVSIDGLVCRPPGNPEQAARFIGQFNVPDYATHARRYFGTFFPNPCDESLRDTVIAEMLATPRHVIASEAEAMADPAQPDWSLTSMAVPLLGLYAQGPLWGAGFEPYFRSLSPRSDLQMSKDAGHFLMLETPGQVNADLMRMLRKHGLLKDV